MIKRLSPTAIGRWSTRRPVLAIAAWLTFVVAAVLALSLTGSKPLENGAVGESARGYALMDAHRLGLPAARVRLPAQRRADGDRPGVSAAIAARRPQRCARDRRRRRVAVSRDQHAALVTAQRHEAVRRRPRLDAAVAAVGDRASGRDRDLRGPDLRREQRPAPRRAALDAGHAAGPAVRVRRARRGARAGAARADRGDRGVRPARADQPGVPARRQRQDGRAADRDGRRRRLRAVLRHPLARGAAPRRVVARGARAHRPAPPAARC